MFDCNNKSIEINKRKHILNSASMKKYKLRNMSNTIPNKNILCSGVPV